MVESRPSNPWQIRLVRPGIRGVEGLPNLARLLMQARLLIQPNAQESASFHTPVRPADLGEVITGVMLARENLLEDVNYQKVAPNHYVVEVSPANYTGQFQPIEAEILRQWRQRLLEDLATANSRQGRKEYRLGGRLRVEIRAAEDLKDDEARILSRVEPEPSAPQPAPRRERGPRTDSGPQNYRDPQPTRRPADLADLPVFDADAPVERQASARPEPAADAHLAADRSSIAEPAAPNSTPPNERSATPHVSTVVPPGGAAASLAFVEVTPGGMRWALYPGVNTIGRSEGCQIYLDLPLVQEMRLVSGYHARIVMDPSGCTLLDGAPDGRPSANGTYLNQRRLPPGGARLRDGDVILLAAADPQYPRADTPGVVTLTFHMDGKGRS